MKTSAKNNTYTLITRKSASILVIFMMLLSCFMTPIGGVLGTTDTAYAKTIGSKNRQACDACNAVANNTSPTLDGETYSQIIAGENTAFMGGLAESKFGTAPVIIDNDPDNFVSVLPYGTVYVDANKISFGAHNGSRASNNGNFKIEINPGYADKFVWAAAKSDFEDAAGNHPTYIIKNHQHTTNTGNAYRNDIAYIGGLKAYLSEIDGVTNPKYTSSLAGAGDTAPFYNVKDYNYLNTPATDKGYQNIIEDSEYLYRFTFYDAVTLPNGTLGDLVITTKKVVFESSIDVPEGNPIGFHGSNYIGINQTYEPGDGESKTWQYIPNLVDLKNDHGEDCQARVAMGVKLSFDIEARYKDGSPVAGTISYATKDLDTISTQNWWGRTSNHGSDTEYEYSEGLTINKGSQSYAVVPKYNPNPATYTIAAANGLTNDNEINDNAGKGWLASNKKFGVTHPLNVQREESGAGHADGLKFVSSAKFKIRDDNGTFNNSLKNASNIISNYSLGYYNDNNLMGYSTLYKGSLPALKRLFPERTTWNESPKNNAEANVLVKDAIDRSNTYSGARNDGGSYDTGFGVLLDAKKASLSWSGSSTVQGIMGTTLFDTSAFVFVNQSHGTGGGTYLESYNLADGTCAPLRQEGVTTMGYGADATITVIPENGYRIAKIRVGNADLSTYTDYTLDDLGLTPGAVATATRDGITFDMNSDGSVDVTLSNVTTPMHVHADFTTDYYFTKVWKKPAGSSVAVPEKLTLKATPFVFEMTEVTVDDVTYTIGDQGTTYTANGNTYELTTNYAVVLANGKTYYLEGNKLVHYPNNDITNNPDEENEITHTITSNPTKAKTFTVDKRDTSNVTVTTEDGNEVWKIKYPAEGASLTNSGAWPALPIETYDGSEHNYNHVERYYWFVGEEAPAGWAMLDYDNSKALAPGWATASDATGTFWKEQSEVYRDATRELIRAQEDNDHAFMSVFNSTNAPSGAPDGASWGGVIENGPAVVLKAEKTWIDFSNDFKTRQDIWLHLDAKLKVWDASANDGSGAYVEKEIKDYLPPQQLASTENTDEDSSTDGTQIVKTWGDMTTYATGDDTKVIIASAKDLPYKDASNNEIAYDTRDERGGFVGSNDITYYVNTLPAYDASGAQIEWSVRETMDKDGNEVVAKDDETSGLIGYKSDNDKDSWDSVKRNTSTTSLNGTDVTTYTGKFKNTLQTSDFTVTKIWKENDSGRTHTVADDAEKLKAAYTLKESDETISDGTNLKLQPSTAAAYTAASGSTAASGTLETSNSTLDGNTTTVFTWHGIPKYVGDGTDVHEAVYSVTESTLAGYNVPTYSGDGKALNEGTITNEVTPPTGTPKETYGAKNTPQTTDGKSLFSVTTATQTDGTSNTIDNVELLDANGNPATEVTVEGGKYTIDSATGIITFTPDTGFVGDPPAVTVRGTDKNGLSTMTTYTPHVVDNEKSVKRTITYEYEDGTPVKDSNGDPKTVVQETIFVGTVDPDTGVVTYTGVKDPVTGTVTHMTDPQTTFPQVDSESIEGYTVDKENVSSKTVKPSDTDSTEKVIYSPKGISATPDETYGLPGQPQTGTVSFTMETETLPDGTPNKVTPKLIDPKTGESCDSVTIPGQGTYTLNSDGTITFTPEDGFVGNPDPVTVEGTDGNGKKARTTYTPHVVNPEQTGTASRTIHYKYLSETGDEVTADITQTVTLYKHAKSVDPKTGEVLEWGDWEPATFPAVKNPDDKVDGKVWFTDDSADELTVSEPGLIPDTYVIYEKIPYKVTYLDGDHGTSDGNGNQTGEDYGSSVSGGNNITPKKGYHFTGKYKYVITDHNGNIIKSGETSDPTELEVIGNIEFTPIYEPNKYTIKYDANGGSGTMRDQNFTGADSSATSKDNEFTRKGYRFTGFKARDKDGNYLKDENGNDLIFENPDDFIEYLHEMGDGGEITLEAQWEVLGEYVEPPVRPDEPEDPKEPAAPKASPKSRVDTGDSILPIVGLVSVLVIAAIIIIAILVRRRKR